MKFELWHAFVIGAVLSWGVYVPVLHEGQTLLGGRPSQGALRAFLCVGLAYLLTAVVIPLILFGIGSATGNTDITAGEKLDFTRDGVFNSSGFTYALLGGIMGAAGALCIVLSIKYGGSPMFIAPLVFAGAPIMNTLVSLAWKTRHMPGPLFFVGIVLAAVGAGLVLYSKADLDQKLRTHPPSSSEAKAANVPQEARP
jgi:hypothetical protein